MISHYLFWTFSTREPALKWGWVHRTPTLFPQTMIFASPFLLCLFQTTLNLRFNMVSRPMSHQGGKGHGCLLQKGYMHCQCMPKLIRTLFLPLEMHQTKLELGVQYKKKGTKTKPTRPPPKHERKYIYYKLPYKNRWAIHVFFQSVIRNYQLIQKQLSAFSFPL